MMTFMRLLAASSFLLVPITLAGTSFVVLTTQAVAANMPLSRVDIVVKKANGEVVARTRSDASGKFSLGELSAGRYSVDFDAVSLDMAIKKFSEGTEGSPRIAILIGLLLPAVQKTVLSTELPVRRSDTGSGATANFSVVVGDWDGDGTDDISRFGGTLTFVK